MKVTARCHSRASSRKSWSRRSSPHPRHRRPSRTCRASRLCRRWRRKARDRKSIIRRSTHFFRHMLQLFEDEPISLLRRLPGCRHDPARLSIKAMPLPENMRQRKCVAHERPRPLNCHDHASCGHKHGQKPISLPAKRVHVRVTLKDTDICSRVPLRPFEL